MQRHKDAVKRARQAEKRRLRNQSVLSEIKTLKKAATTTKDSAKVEAIKRFASAVGKASRKGVLHRNTASRMISRAAKAK